MNSHADGGDRRSRADDRPDTMDQAIERAIDEMTRVDERPHLKRRVVERLTREPAPVRAWSKRPLPVLVPLAGLVVIVVAIVAASIVWRYGSGPEAPTVAGEVRAGAHEPGHGASLPPQEPAGAPPAASQTRGPQVPGAEPWEGNIPPRLSGTRAAPVEIERFPRGEFGEAYVTVADFLLPPLPLPERIEIRPIEVSPIEIEPLYVGPLEIVPLELPALEREFRQRPQP
jgi:hypothetical protein